MENTPVLSVIIPCYNEHENIDYTVSRLIEILKTLEDKGEISQNSFLFFVDDGSSDNSWELIQKYNKETNGKVKGITFSRNFGNQKALLAGLTESSKYNADCFITIDADLQQDEEKIQEFVEKYKNGAKIVLGIRKDRKTDGLLKKITAIAFYKLMNLLGVNIKINHSDYRLISKEAVESLKKYNETNLFLRGMFNELGFKKDYVYFDVKPRKYGKTKYTSFSLFALALNGITSYSLVPLRFVTVIGFLISLVSILIGAGAFIDYFINKNIVPGWTTIVVVMGFVSGVQILCLGIMAEYLGQLFQEVKARPRYIIEDEIG